MHIADGVLPTSFCLAALGLSAAGAYVTSRRPAAADASKIGLLAAAGFTASLISFPIAGLSAHFGLYGLLGILLGRRSFSLVFLVLLLQALLLQHGGLVSLGVNSLNMGLGAILAWGIWSLSLGSVRARSLAAGFVGAFAPALLMALEFFAFDYGHGFLAIVALYAPVAVVEGILTAVLVDCFSRLKPEVLSPAVA